MTFKKCQCFFAACLFFFLSSMAAAQFNQGDREMVKLKLEDFKKQLSALSVAGYDIAGINRDDGTVDIIVEQSHKSDLYAFGEILDSVQERTTRLDSQYTDYDEAMDILASLAQQYSDLTTLLVLGESHEGRDIVAMKISDNPNVREVEEPAVLFNANHHAREVMTVEVVLDTAEYLLSNYGIDNKVTHWVDNNEIWVIPVVNPDGLTKVFTNDSWWRKNTREGYGVDLNRNYPFNWDLCNGSSGSTSSDTYRGPSAGSEPEAQAVMALVDAVQPVFDISYHSYSELVLYPYGCESQNAPNKDILEAVGRDLANQLPKDSGSGYYEPGTPPELLYSADGGDMDWMYGAHDVLAYVIEVNSSSQGFQPEYSWRQPTVEKLRAGWGYLLDRLEESGVRGTFRDPDGNLVGNAKIVLKSLSYDDRRTLEFRAKKDGSYHLVLKPGMYRLTCYWTDKYVQEEITVGADLVKLDFQF